MKVRETGARKAAPEFKYKQVIVIRVDLGMSRGKIAAQAGHAAVTAAEKARGARQRWWSGWMEEGQRKVVVKVKSEQELVELELQARQLGLPTALIVDRGLTELPPGTVTCVGIGPAPAEQVDKVTGNMPLL